MTQKIDKRACRKFAIPELKFNLNEGILHVERCPYIIRTAVHNISGQRILVLYIYQSENILAGSIKPRWVVFQGRYDFATLSLRENASATWQCSTLDSLGRIGGFDSKCAFYRRQDEARVARFCKCERGAISVLGYLQRLISRHRELERKWKKQRAIIERMKYVPVLPRDLKGFIHREVMPQYIFYDYQRKGPEHAFCTACRHEVSIAAAKHNTSGICPHCKKKILFKSRGKRGRVFDRATIQVLQKAEVNGLVLRIIKVYDKDGTATRETNPWYGQPIPAYRRGYTLFANSHLPEKITVFGVGQRTQDIYNADILRDILAKTVITRTFEEVTGKDIKRIHQEPIPFSAEEKAVWVQAVKEFHTMRQKYFTSTNNARKDAMLRIIQQITLLLRISAAPNTVSEYSGELPGKLRRTIQLTGSWAEEIVAIGVRHTVVLDAYAAALREAFPNRPLFIVTGATTTFAKRRALRQTLRESGNGILLCTQQSLPSSVNFEFVNKVIIPELHYNNSRMSQFYMRFIRFNSVDWKDIYFLTYAQSIESNLMQMILAKEKLNLFMKGDEADMDDIYERFGVDYDLTSLLLYRDIDEDGRFSIRWGEQEIA